MSIATSHRIDKLPGELSDKVAIALGWDANGRVDLDLHVAYTESDPAHPRFAYFARPVVSTEAANLSYDRDLQSYAELSGLCEVVRINSTSRTGKLKARFLVIRVHWYAGEATSANGHLRIFPNANDSEFVEVNIPQIRPGEWKEIVIPIM